MNKPTKSLLPFLALLACVGCDTTEELYSVGDSPKESEILKVDKGSLAFKPEGESKEIQITSLAKWEVSIPNDKNSIFSVSPTSGKGNGTITVTCGANSGQDGYTAELSVTPLNFAMEPITVSLRQTNAIFDIESRPSEVPTAEQGGNVTMTAYSSLSWELEVVGNPDGSKGDINWLSITPGISGEGNEDNKPIYFSFTWNPNYEQKERVISLQFKPSSNIGVTNPQPFILKQDAGTLTQDVRCKATLQGVVDADITLEYSSKSAVKDCGLKVYSLKNDIATEIGTVRPDASEYSLTGNYILTLRDLPEASDIRVEPFVENQVGVQVGDPCEFKTGTKPENMVYQGVFISNTDEDPITVTTDQTSATVSFTVTSDVEPLGSDRLERVTMTINGQAMSKTPDSSEPGRWKYAFTIDGLDPNHEYGYEIVVNGRDLPPALGKVENTTASYSDKFKTKGKTPGDNDNNKPIVGE